MKLSLVRDYNGADCTQGRISLLDLTLDTMERPWIASASGPCGTKGVSCVPVGEYKLVRHNSEAHPRTWALVNPSLWIYHWEEDVPAEQKGIARTLVLIHAANYASELRGCIAPGQGRAVSNGRRMVTHSRLAMDSLQQRLSWDDDHALSVT